MLGGRKLLYFHLLCTFFAFSGGGNAASAAQKLSCPKNDHVRGVAQSTWHEQADDTAFVTFANEPTTAACYLINELHSVPEKWIRGGDQKKHPNTMHVIWSLRALRHITGGLRFKGATKYLFNESSEIESNRKQFLSPENNEVPFFAVWMSRDSVAIAPADAQKEIIEKWIDWYERAGATFKYHAAKHVDDWYF
jgi:hypothetical protein